MLIELLGKAPHRTNMNVRVNEAKSNGVFDKIATSPEHIATLGKFIQLLTSNRLA